MSPRYKEVVVPDGLEEAEFENQLERLGGTFKGKSPLHEVTKELASSLWREQRGKAIDLVSSFREGHKDPEVESGINKGIVLLVGAIDKEGEAAKTCDWPLFGERLGELFEKWLPEKIPEDVTIALGHLTRRGSRDHRPLPRGIIYIIQRYGLSDGVQRSLTDMSRDYGIRRSAINQVIDKSLHQIRLNKEIRELLSFGPIHW